MGCQFGKKYLCWHNSNIKRKSSDFTVLHRDFLRLRSNAKAIRLTSSWTTAEAENWLHNLRGDRGCQRSVLLSLSATSADTLWVLAAAPSLLGLGARSVNRSLSVISLSHS